jgi:hypothetical protein
MATYYGKASWFCCYPDPCGCDGCCCQGSNCSTACGNSSYCGVGGCCTCRSGSYGFAWKTGCSWCCNYSAYKAVYCGNSGTFSYGGRSRTGTRVDTGPSTCVMVDFTKALFSQFASLSTGIISNVQAVV